MQSCNYTVLLTMRARVGWVHIYLFAVWKPTPTKLSPSTRNNSSLLRFDHFLKSLHDQSQPGMERDQKKGKYTNAGTDFEMTWTNIQWGWLLRNSSCTSKKQATHTVQRLSATFPCDLGSMQKQSRTLSWISDIQTSKMECKTPCDVFNRNKGEKIFSHFSPPIYCWN